MQVGKQGTEDVSGTSRPGPCKPVANILSEGNLNRHCLSGTLSPMAATPDMSAQMTSMEMRLMSGQWIGFDSQTMSLVKW